MNKEIIKNDQVAIKLKVIEKNHKAIKTYQIVTKRQAEYKIVGFFRKNILQVYDWSEYYIDPMFCYGITDLGYKNPFFYKLEDAELFIKYNYKNHGRI